MWRNLLILAPLALPTARGAEWLSNSQLCVLACQDSLGSVAFGTTVHTDDYYTGYCEDTLRFQSTYLCARDRCSPQEIESGLKSFQETCDIVHLTIPSYEEVIANYSAQEPSPTMSYDDVFEESVNNTLVPNDELFDLGYRSWTDWIVVSQADYHYAWAMYGFWAIVLSVGIVNRLFAALVQWTMRRTHHDSEASIDRHQFSKPRFSRVRRLIQTQVTLPALFGYRHQDPFGWCTVPTRIQTFLVFAFVAINLILCSVTYRAFDHNIFWPIANRQTWTYIADRTGIVAIANYALLWAFAGRNDIFLWLTGWNYATFNVFHRWIARVITLEVIVHSIAFTALALLDGGSANLAASNREEYWYCGVIATTAMGLLLGFSAYPIRQKAYELFLKIHISLAIFALVCTFYHIKIYDGEFEPYLWPCVAVWCFDYFLRLVRLVMLNYKIAFGRRTKAVVKYNAQMDIIRIDLTPSFQHQPRPGTHYFLYFPTMLKSVGNHPFSLSGWTSPGARGSPTPVEIRSSAIDLEKIQRDPAVNATEAEVSSQTNTSENSTSTTKELQFVIRPYKGLTASLRDEVVKTGLGRKEMNVLIEGPYGHPHPILHYDSVLFMVGGSGIAAALPYIQEFLRPRHTIRAKHIHLVWAVREYSFARDVLDNELAPGASASAHDRVKLDFFVTGQSPKAVKDDGLDLDRFEEADTRISYQRFVADTMVREEVSQAVGSLAVLACGPAQLADDARRAAVQAIKNGFDRLEYFEEQFGW